MGSARDIHDITLLKAQKWYPRMLEDIRNPENSYAAIAKKYGLTQKMMQRFVRTQLQESLARSLAFDEPERLEAYQDRVTKVQAFLDKIIESCDRYLADPEDPSRYTMMPRADEIKVIWYDEATKSNHLDFLDDLLRDLREGGIDPVRVKIVAPDRYKIMLEALKVAKDAAYDAFQVMQTVKEVKDSADITGVIVPTITNLMLDATVDAPIVRERLMHGMEMLLMQIKTGVDPSRIRIADVQTEEQRKMLS